jgi:hypothetical protein
VPIEINKRQCVFWAPLDTVLQPGASRLEPLLKFFALLTHHIVVTDTQLLDNAFFRHDRIADCLPLLFSEDGGDGLPFVLVAKRDPASTLVDILYHDMARMGPYQATIRPMHFSSLSHEQRCRLVELYVSRGLSPSAFEREVGYPVTNFAHRISRLVDEATYIPQLAWPNPAEMAGGYPRLLQCILKSPCLPAHVGLATAPAKRFLHRLCDEIRLESETRAAKLSRTDVYRRLDRCRMKRRKNKLGLAKIDSDEFDKAIRAVKCIADYAYLRNFSDRCGFSFLVDNVHWLASSVVNRELADDRPAAEMADSLVEAMLDIQEGAFEGYGSAVHQTLSECLIQSTFAQSVSWRDILSLRRRAAFWDNLQQIETYASSGGQAESVRKLDEHVRWAFSESLRRDFNWADFFTNTFFGTVGLSASLAGSAALAAGATYRQAAIAFATGGGGPGLTVGLRHLGRHVKHSILIDGVAHTVVRAFERRNSA